MEWIETKERLPETGGIYNIVVDGVSRFGSWDTYEQDWIMVQSADHPRNDEGWFSLYRMTVTHWAENPAPPV